MANNGNSGFLAGLIVGGAAGFIFGIMSAPKSGEETRNQLWDNTRDARLKLEDMMETARERLDEAGTEVARTADMLRAKVRQVNNMSDMTDMESEAMDPMGTEADISSEAMDPMGTEADMSSEEDDQYGASSTRSTT